MCVQVLYSLATQRFSRGTVFNIVMSVFLAFMAAFGLLYPSHEVLHFSTMAGKATGYLPTGITLPLPSTNSSLPDTAFQVI